MFIKKSVTLLSTLVILILAGCGGGVPDGQYDEFAQCLSDEGLTMYGAFWCPHCADQKDLFGDSFEYVSYVECDPRDPDGQPELCLAEGIESYPTWTYSDGRRWEGVQQMEELAEVTGCEYAEDSEVVEEVKEVEEPSE